MQDIIIIITGASLGIFILVFLILRHLALDGIIQLKHPRLFFIDIKKGDKNE
jgi:hypothetical protein